MTIDGKKISQEILDQLKIGVAALPFKPLLVDVFVGSDPVIETYVHVKERKAAEIGIDFYIHKLPETILQEDLEREVRELNSKPNICGLIVQLPLPSHINRQKVLDQINPAIDVDVTTSTNLGCLFTGQQLFNPATAAAIINILDYHKVDLHGKQTLVVGAGDLVGKPVTFLLMQRMATVTVANHLTKNLKELCLQADIIISGTGVLKIITGDMVKEGVIVIDAGTAESAGGIGGDVDFDEVAPKASLITPVPGGVGPMTVAMLLNNVMVCANRKVAEDRTAN